MLRAFATLLRRKREANVSCFVPAGEFNSWWQRHRIGRQIIDDPERFGSWPTLSFSAFLCEDLCYSAVKTRSNRREKGRRGASRISNLAAVKGRIELHAFSVPMRGIA